MNLAIIDIDGVLANGEARFELADASGFPQRGSGADNYWAIAFKPEFVALDKPFDGILQQVDTIQGEDYRIIYITSRPENLAQVTREWLDRQDLPCAFFPVILKPSAAKFVKTPDWKASIIHALTNYIKTCWGLESLLIVDDEMMNREAIAQAIGWPDAPICEHIGLSSNLTEALAEIAARQHQGCDPGLTGEEGPPGEPAEVEPEEIPF